MPTELPHVARVRISDPERFVEAIRGADVTPCQLSHAPRISELSRIVLPSSCLNLARMGPAMMFTGTTPCDCYSLFFVLECPVEAHSFNFSTRFTDGYLACYPPGAVLDSRTPEGYANVSLTIPTARFLEAVAVHGTALPDSMLIQGIALRIRPADQTVLRRLVAEVNALPLGPECPLRNAMARQSLEDGLLTAFFSMLRSGWEDRVPPPRGKMANRHHRFRQVREYIASRPGETLRLEELCASAGLSARALENLFQDFLGISPHQFLRHQRLHHVRRILRQRPCIRPGDIKQIALDHGFWHLGRFSSYYRDLFGESPSRTVSGC